MKRIKMLLMGAALVAASSALATAQPVQGRHEGRFEERDHDRGRGHHYGRDNHRFRDRDDFRFRDRDDRWRFKGRYAGRDDYYRYRVGERRFFNGFYWTWDGNRWCRRNHGIVIYFRF